MTTSPSGILLCIVLLASQTFAWQSTDTAVTKHSNGASLAVADSDRSPSMRIISRDATPEPSLAPVEDFASVMFSDNTIDFIPELENPATVKPTQPITAEPIDPTEFLVSIGAIESTASIESAEVDGSTQSNDATSVAPFKLDRLIGPVEPSLAPSPPRIDSPSTVSFKLASFQVDAAEPTDVESSDGFSPTHRRYLYRGWHGEYHLAWNYATAHYTDCGHHYIVYLRYARQDQHFLYYESLDQGPQGPEWAFARRPYNCYYSVWRQRTANSEFCQFDCCNRYWARRPNY